MNKANTGPTLTWFTIYSVGDRTGNITIKKIISATGNCYEEMKEDDVIESV